MDENDYKKFCINIWDKLKSTCNASINCQVDTDKDILHVSFERLGINYDTSVKNVSDILKNGEDEIDKCITEIVKSYKNFIKHKFFY